MYQTPRHEIIDAIPNERNGTVRAVDDARIGHLPVADPVVTRPGIHPVDVADRDLDPQQPRPGPDQRVDREQIESVLAD